MHILSAPGIVHDMRHLVVLSAFIGGALSQIGPWQQCGGIGYSGQSNCVSGYYCEDLNPYYYQCVPSAASTTLVSSTSTSISSRATSTPTTLRTTTSTSTTSSASATPTDKFRWFGVDESGAEFGTGNIPGVYGTDFIFPSVSTLQTLMGQGFNIFRLPFLMERMVPNELTGPVDTAYMTNYSVAVNYITSNGGYAIVDPHNYGRYYGNIINDTAGFEAFWVTVASYFSSNSKVIFDTNNEYHDMEQTLVYDLNQAAINGIRSIGATSQYIFVEGNSYTGAWTWNTTNTDLGTLQDPENLIVFEMHQYLDSDGSGTSATCVSSDVGVQRIEGATAWLQQNDKLGFLGEYAGGANSVCEEAIVGMLNSMLAGGGVWLGACWWGGGPWWGDYIYSFEPPSGTAYTYYDTLLETYAPS